jgi:hypothetical protein
VKAIFFSFFRSFSSFIWRASLSKILFIAAPCFFML